MQSLTNFYGDCALINLEPSTPGGPYVVVQKALDPEAMSLREELFFLRRDGVWVEEIARTTLPEEDRFAVVFERLDEVMAVLGKLSGPPEILRVTVSREQVDLYLAALKAAGSSEALIRGMLARYRAQRTPAGGS